MKNWVWIFLPDGREDHHDETAVFKKKADAVAYAGAYLRRHNFDRRTEAVYQSEIEMANPEISDSEIYRRWNSGWFVSGCVVRKAVRDEY